MRGWPRVAGLRSATQPQPGCGSWRGMPDSSRPISATPTCPLSAATPTSRRRSCTMRRQRSLRARRCRRPP